MGAREILTEKRIENIRLIAEQARSSSRIKNPTSIAAALGYDVRFVNLTGDPPAFVDGSATIYISNFVDSYSKQILCAHELGHLLTGNCQAVSLFDASIDSVEEFEANMFLYYLMPQAFTRINFSQFDTIGDFNKFVVSQIAYIKY